LLLYFGQKSEPNFTMSEATPGLKILPSLMEAEFNRILLKYKFTPEKAATLANIYTVNSLEGVYTHGVNRFAKFIKYVVDGHVKPDAEPECKHRAGALEQWAGNLGPGPLNALACTDRAVEIAGQAGIGCVALGNTNHWMRGGTYGWRAAEKGCAFIGWTNTIKNMPAWGGVNAKLGNNPLVIAVPYQDDAIVLDMAMSQFSYGALDLHVLRKQQLPVPGGYDKSGKLTTDPALIRESERTLPIGYWKGSGLSFLLDILAAILSAGSPVFKISQTNVENDLSQVFIAVNLSKLGNASAIQGLLRQIIDDYHQSVPAGDSKVLYPGERVIRVREENLKNGIPVIQKVWDEILAL
jgi:3-dehydro-L-gulonate 2-dehydrogenase